MIIRVVSKSKYVVSKKILKPENILYSFFQVSISKQV